MRLRRTRTCADLSTPVSPPAQKSRWPPFSGNRILPSFLSGCTAVKIPCGNSQIPIIGKGWGILVKSRSACQALNWKTFKMGFSASVIFSSILKKLKCIKNILRNLNGIYQQTPLHQTTGYDVRSVPGNRIPSLILEQHSTYIDLWKIKSHLQEKNNVHLYMVIYLYIFTWQVIL